MPCYLLKPHHSFVNILYIVTDSDKMSMHSVHWVNKVNVVFLSARASIPEPLNGTRRKLICSVYTNNC